MTPVIVKKEIAQQRYNICKQCDDFTIVKICKNCNCFMPVKVKFALAQCPKLKWPGRTQSSEHQANAYEDLE